MFVWTKPVIIRHIVPPKNSPTTFNIVIFRHISCSNNNNSIETIETLGIIQVQCELLKKSIDLFERTQVRKWKCRFSVKECCQENWPRYVHLSSVECNKTCTFRILRKYEGFSFKMRTNKLKTIFELQ